MVVFLRLIPAINSINIQFQMLKSSIRPLHEFMEFIDLSASAGERIKTGRKIDTNLDGDILLSAEKLQYGVSDLRDINQVS